ncbi:MAG: SapC family protein [Pseudomonadota bacterium]
MNLTPLNFKQHGKLRAAPESALRFAKTQHVLNMRASEVGFAAVSMPIFVNKNQHSGRWALSALTSFLPGRNLFIGTDGWQPTWIPTLIQCHPLYLVNAETESGYAVAIDTTGDDFSETTGEPLFHEDGRTTDYTNAVANLLDTDIKEAVKTQFFLSEIEKAQLLRPVNIRLEFEDAPTQTIRGLHTIDEERLKNLDGETLERFSKSSFLLLMYAMLTSLNHLNTLVRRHNVTPGIPKISKIGMTIPESEGAAGGEPPSE